MRRDKYYATPQECDSMKTMITKTPQMLRSFGVMYRVKDNVLNELHRGRKYFIDNIYLTVLRDAEVYWLIHIDSRTYDFTKLVSICSDFKIDIKDIEEYHITMSEL